MKKNTMKKNVLPLQLPLSLQSSLSLVFLFTLLVFQGGCFDPFTLSDKKEEDVYKKFSKAIVEGAQKAQVVFDNDKAFESKIKIVENAKHSLKMIYYIFLDDTSSAYLAQKIIEAARRGVKVEILVDLHQEYMDLAYFSMLMEQGQGNIDVRFYGRPGMAFMKDVVYLTSNCLDNKKNNKQKCDQIKNKKIDELFSKESEENKRDGISNINTGYSGQFLAGLYAKDFTLLGSSVLAGQQVDISEFKNKGSKSYSEEDIESLKKLGVTAWKAQHSSSALERLAAKLKVQIAFSAHADQLNPIREALKTYLPLSGNKDKDRLRQWMHITDFVHHKFLMADGKRVQLGGRNIQNSYHMKRNDQLKSYTSFMDTDIYLELPEKNKELEKSFNDLFNYRAVVAKLSEVEQFAPVESYLEKKYLNQTCSGEDDKEDFQECVDEAPAFSMKEHKQKLYQTLTQRAQKYVKEYEPKRNLPLVEKYVDLKDKGGVLDISPQAKLYYFENVPYTLDSNGQPSKRVYGTEMDQKTYASKGIHAMWGYQFIRSCMVSKKEKRDINIYVNNAYLMPSGEMLSMMKHMTDGTLDCRRVTVHIMTNSRETTDLLIINVAADFVLQAFLSSHRRGQNAQRGNNKSANFVFYEYTKLNYDENTVPPSLHSKVVVFDQSVFVGSANFDTRSIVMDTNNGFLITQDLNLVSEYQKIMNLLIKKGVVVEVANLLKQNSPFYTEKVDYFIEKNHKFVKALLKKQKIELTEGKEKLFDKAFTVIANKIYKSTNEILFNQTRQRTQGKNEMNTHFNSKIEIDEKAIKTYNRVTKEF